MAEVKHDKVISETTILDAISNNMEILVNYNGGIGRINMATMAKLFLRTLITITNTNYDVDPLTSKEPLVVTAINTPNNRRFYVIRFCVQGAITLLALPYYDGLGVYTRVFESGKWKEWQNIGGQ